MKIRATQAIMECLLEQEVDTVFGYPGGTILNVYDELYNYKDKIHHVLTAHEQGASHAADGYARSTGKVGVCFATSGPGATNLTTGIATAYMDVLPRWSFSPATSANLFWAGTRSRRWTLPASPCPSPRQRTWSGTPRPSPT